MAKDLVDTMMEMVMDFFLWIFKIIAKLTVGAVKFLISMIVAFFRGKKDQEPPTQKSNQDDQPEKLWLYDDFISDMNALKSKFSGEELMNQSMGLMVNLLVNFNISAEDKCKGLQESKTIVKDVCNNDHITFVTFWSKTITTSYTIMEAMVSQSDIIAKYKQEFNDDMTSSNLKQLEEYLANIISIAGAIAANGSPYKFDGSLLNKYSLPQWVD